MNVVINKNKLLHILTRHHEFNAVKNANGAIEYYNVRNLISNIVHTITQHELHKNYHTSIETAIEINNVSCLETSIHII